MGRISKYNPETARKICDLLAMGKSLRRICKDNDDFPSESTVRAWVIDDVGGFSAQYDRSRNIGLDAVADEMLDIADDGVNDYVQKELQNGNVTVVLNKEAVMRSRLRFEARQWYLSKLAPKRYAQRSYQELTGKDGAALNPAAISDEQLAAALNALAVGVPVHKDPFEDDGEVGDASDLV